MGIYRPRRQGKHVLRALLEGYIVDYNANGDFISDREACVAETEDCPCGKNTAKPLRPQPVIGHRWYCHVYIWYMIKTSIEHM